MKRFLILTLLCVFAASAGFAQHQPAGDQAAESTSAVKPGSEEIHWMSIDDVQVAMKRQPKKVWIDVYTDWCGWCKRMDKTTFANPEVIRYMNQHFYAVRLNAEQQGDIRFNGKMFRSSPSDRTHPFANDLLKGQLSYPTSVFMEENFQTPQLIPGYQDVKTMEMILKYLGEGIYRKTPFEQFQASFKPTWVTQ